MFSVGGSYGDGNITYNGTSLKKGVKLDSKGSITFTPAKNYNMTIVMGTAKNGRDVKINNVLTTVSGTENAEGKYYQLQPIAITKDTQPVRAWMGNKINFVDETSDQLYGQSRKDVFERYLSEQSNFATLNL